MTSIRKYHRDLREGSKKEGLQLAGLGKSSGFWLRACLGPSRAKLCGGMYPVSGYINELDKIRIARGRLWPPIDGLKERRIHAFVVGNRSFAGLRKRTCSLIRGAAELFLATLACMSLPPLS